MFKNILRRYLSIVLAVFMTLSLVPASAMTVVAADETLNLSVEGLTATHSSGSFTASGTSIQGSVKGESGCNDEAGEASLTLTNNKATAAILSFDYSLTFNGGSASINGEGVTSDGSFNAEIDPGESVKIQLKTQAGDYTTSIEMTNITLVVDVDATTTFQVSENGTYTVNGTAVTETTVITQHSTESYSVSATPADGYKFYRWYNEVTGKTLSGTAATSFQFDSDQTVVAEFVANGTALFETAGEYFADLDEAVAYAQSVHAGKITLADNGTLPAGSYTIPRGITLLIPFDAAGTTYTAAPESVTGYSRPSAFRTLTMASGANLIVEGALSLSAKHYAAGGGSNGGGSPVGKVGWITMESDSHIVVNNGGALYAWGFITGSGDVHVESGSTVYENFQIGDFRGGRATLTLSSGPIFPFSQYYVQNVEVPMTVMSGATEMLYSSLLASGSSSATSIEFIGSNGMFTLSEGSSLTKTYDGSSDRLIIDVNGSSQLKNLTVGLGGLSVNSAGFNLPINSNITINVHSGMTTINQALALLPGAEVTVDSGATLNVAADKNIYIYDADQWGNYAYTYQWISVPYAPSKTYNRGKADLKDAVVDINGEVIVNGAVYTTESGANITSSAGTGKFTFASNAGIATTTKQYQNNSTEVTINVTSAKLHNKVDDPEYTETADAVAGDTYYFYSDTGIWSKDEPTEDVDVTITFDANEGAGEMEALTAKSGEETTLTANAFTREGYDFTGWNTAADGTGTAYADAAAVTVTEDTTLYAQWKIKTFTVTWLDADGAEIGKTEDVAYGTTPEYTGETPEKAETDEYSYTFKGWDPEITEETKITADTSFKAVFEAAKKSYTVTFKNADGTTLETQDVEYGETPIYGGATPEKTGDAQYSYTFAGWDPAISEVTGAAEYMAKFTQAVNEYDVTWVDEDDTVLQAASKVPYGVIPEYKGAAPTKDADAQYTYTFAGWNQEVTEVTGDITYKAVYSKTVNEYTVTWKNEDGTELSTETLAYGETPVYSGTVPTKEGNAQYVYTFEDWTPEITAVTGDITYTAVFTQSLRKYNVTWKLSDEDEGETVEVEYGAQPAYPHDEDPSKEDDEEYSYIFMGWDPEITDDTVITEDAVFTAQFEKKRIAFTVTWQNYDGTVLREDKLVKEGTTPSYTGAAPSAPVKKWYTYSFTGWLPEIAPITEDVTYSAQFSETGITGWQIDETGTTYVENGEQKYFDTWAEIDGNTYFFNAQGYIVKGLFTTKAQDKDEYGTFVFDQETGVFRSDLTGLYEDGKDTYWVEGGRVAEGKGLVKVEEVYYYFDENGKAVKATEETTDYLVEENNGLALPTGIRYKFDESGVIVHDNTSWQGIHEIDGKKYDYIDGVRIPWGLFKRDGDYYYARTSTGELVCGRSYWVSKTNNLMDEGKYEFDEDGKMVFDDPDVEVKNGIVAENGSLYYYEDGVLAPVGLIKIDGDYYYVRTSNGEVVHGRSYWASVTNNLLPEAKYTFDDDGKMIDPPTDPVDPDDPDTPVKNGIVSENGSLYYYVDGVLTPAGLIKIGDDYYYVRTSNGEVIHGRSYWVSVTNNLLPAKSYTFGDDGKMVQQ